jgi:alpha-glucoside transport system permease protein
MAAGTKSKKQKSTLMVNGVLILICSIWLLPTLGVFITSFRDSQDIFNSGWWAVFPHKEDIDIGEVILDDDVDVNGKISVEGITATFEELREGVTLPDGRKLTWYGNKRTRKIIISEQMWVGFANNLTLENYKDVITGKEITFTDAGGNEILRRGNNLGGAFLNSIAVAVPATIDCGVCRFRVFLVEISRKRFVLYNDYSDSCGTFTDFFGSYITRLH